jgi:aryl-alcohol dehydrogenase-like predicted oxidoreductase
MRTRRLGNSDLEIPVVVFGAWAIGGWGWGGRDAATDAAAVDALRHALDVGSGAIDTAPVYGFGHSEELVARAIAGRRDRVVVMTKAGLRWDDERGKLSFEGTDDRGIARKLYRNSRPDSVKAECEASLRRLGVDVIDLLQIHWPDPTTPIADTMGALLELRAAGQIRACGVSNYSVDELEEARRALGDVPLASDQPKSSLVHRAIEVDVLPYAREHGVGVVAYSPLEQGLLTG